jgi:hypothetical protein
MSHSVDYHLIAFHFEQGTIVTYSQSVFRGEVRQAFHITRKIIPHGLNLFDDALRRVASWLRAFDLQVEPCCRVGLPLFHLFISASRALASASDGTFIVRRN